MRIINRIGAAVKAFRSGAFSSPPDWLTGGFYGRTNKSGKIVNHSQALACSALFACIRKLSTDIASLPLEVYASDGDQSILASSHPGYRLVHRKPNERDTPAYFQQLLVANAILRGVGYAIIERDQFSGLPVALWPVSNSAVNRLTFDGGRQYVYDVRGIGRFLESDMIRVSSFLETDVVKEFNQLIGLNLAAEEYAAMYFGNGGKTDSYLTTAGTLTNDQIKSTKEQWNSNGHHGTPVLQGGLEVKSTGSKPTESQLTESRDFNGEEVARIIGIPAGLVGYETGTKYNGVEDQDLHYYKHVLRPWCRHIEQEMDRKLLRVTEFENGTHKFKYNMDAILRGDIKARTEHYMQMLDRGVYSINDVRRRENLNSVDHGDLRLIQVNRIPLDYADAFGQKVSAQTEPISQAQ